MKKRNKWLCIGCLAFVIAIGVFLCYDEISAWVEMHKMANRRSMLLYHTNHQLLLEDCRELSQQMTTGKLEVGLYSIHSLIVKQDPQIKQFPQSILELDPVALSVEKDGEVSIAMWPIDMYGVEAFPEDYKGSINEDNLKWKIKLLDGLWYYDEDFITHPEHKKDVEKLLKERKIISGNLGTPY
jgi:hypothetical protein